MAMTSHPAGWSRPLRIIHLLLALAVTAQLFVGSFMRGPHPARPDSFGFASHEVLGTAILLLVVAHWLWILAHPAEGWRGLFPWTRSGMRRVVHELWAGLRYRRLPSSRAGSEGALAGFVHGLGLLAVSATAVIGGTFFLARMAGASHVTLGAIENVHDVFAVLVWAYWSGHLGITILHSLLRQPVWKPMFHLDR